jgi:hypothetical protein
VADPVALGARLGLDPLTEPMAGDAAAVSRTLADQANAVVGLLPVAPDAPETPAEPWVLTAEDGRLPLRAAMPAAGGWPVGADTGTARVRRQRGRRPVRGGPGRRGRGGHRPGRAAPAGRCWSPR